MSETIQRPERFFTMRRIIGAAAAVVAVGATVKYAPEIANAIDKRSLIVAGVPGQVETYQNRTLTIRGVTTYLHWLGIEQCPDDIANAKQGKITQSFNPELGTRYTNCNFDWVSVNGGTLSSVTLGQTITFEGPVGEPLKK